MEDSRLLCKLRRIGSTPFQSQKLKSFHMPPGPEIDVQAVAVLCLKVTFEQLSVISGAGYDMLITIP